MPFPYLGHAAVINCLQLQESFTTTISRNLSQTKISRGGGNAEVAFALLTRQPRVRFLAFPRMFPIILDAAEINRRHFLECGKA